MDVPRHNEPLIVTDAAVNIVPDFEAKVDIVQARISDHGYMIAPTTPMMHERLSKVASLRGIPIDRVPVPFPGMSRAYPVNADAR